MAVSAGQITRESHGLSSNPNDVRKSNYLIDLPARALRVEGCRPICPKGHTSAGTRTMRAASTAAAHALLLTETGELRDGNINFTKFSPNFDDLNKMFTFFCSALTSSAVSGDTGDHLRGDHSTFRPRGKSRKTMRSYRGHCRASLPLSRTALGNDWVFTPDGTFRPGT
jgi:hypothetical protein